MTTRTATPNRLILQSLEQADPRTLLDDHALVEASHNGFPVVAARQGRQTRDMGGLLVGGSVAVLLGGLTFWSMSGHRMAPSAPVMASPRTIPALAPPPSATAPLPAPRPLLMPSVPSVAPPTIVDHGPAPVVVFDNSAAPTAATPATAPAPAATAATKSPLSTGGNDNDQFAQRVGGDSTDVATAQRLSDPATTVTQGTLIPAVLETAINTDLPGYVRAVVSRDVKSFDGRHVLIPRSSRLIGQYKSGLSAGQTRAYIIWSRLIRPDGVSVALASPAVDFSGTSGLGGKVDGHFMKRFGAAALLTVIGGLSAIGNSSVVLSGGGQSAAGVAAQGTTQIPPTIRVAQGQPIRVFTARDLDFSTVSDGTPS